MVNSTSDFYQEEAKKYFDSTYHIKLNNIWDYSVDFIPQNAKILDLGCGSGRDILFFSSLFENVIGLDLSYNLSYLARVHTSQPIVQADFKFAPFANNSFDVVWSIGSLLHVKKENIIHALIEIRRMLINDGLLIVSLKKGVGEETLPDGRFFAYYSKNEWKAILSKCGFKLLKIKITKEERFLNNSEKSITIPWLFTISQKKKE